MASFPTAFSKGNYEDEVRQKHPLWNNATHRQPVNKVLREPVNRESNTCMTSVLTLGGTAYTPLAAMIMRKVDPLVILLGCAERPSLECATCGEGRWFHQYQTKEVKSVIQSAQYGCLACIADDSNSNDTGAGSAIQWWGKAKREYKKVQREDCTVEVGPHCWGGLRSSDHGTRTAFWERPDKAPKSDE